MKTVAALVPAHNEASVLAATLKSIARQVKPADIYVVDDGSSDDTSAVAKKYTQNVLTLKTNLGKAEALNAAISRFDLPRRYRFLFFMDADTQLQPGFITASLPHFSDPAAVCVVGRVQTLGGSWVARYRFWEYEIGHTIHKAAQFHVGSILVVPGCATVYRTSVFKTLRIPTGTLTEDMDFTFMLHRQNQGRIIFEPKAVVLTQDPQTISSFIIQVKRWYTGFWQVVAKHDLPWHGQALDFEVTLLALEGLLNSLVSTVIIGSLPFLAASRHLTIYQFPLVFDLLVFFLPTLLYTVVKTRRFSLLKFIPHFYFLRLLTSMLFIYGFFAANVRTNRKLTWNTQRFNLTNMSTRRVE